MRTARPTTVLVLLPWDFTWCAGVCDNKSDPALRLTSRQTEVDQQTKHGDTATRPVWRFAHPVRSSEVRSLTHRAPGPGSARQRPQAQPSVALPNSQPNVANTISYLATRMAPHALPRPFCGTRSTDSGAWGLGAGHNSARKKTRSKHMCGATPGHLPPLGFGPR
jgi:hypothetical protein